MGFENQDSREPMQGPSWMAKERLCKGPISYSADVPIASILKKMVESAMIKFTQSHGGTQSLELPDRPEYDGSRSTSVESSSLSDTHHRGTFAFKVSKTVEKAYRWG